jgi:outer membrane protein G
MRNIVLALVVLSGFFGQAQVFKGKGDTKFQVGAIFQEYANGITATTDFGLGKNLSVGFQSTYLLGVKEDIVLGSSKFEDRFDIRGRFNAHISDIFGIEKDIDIYPGLDLGLRNFGAHFGARYFFTEGIGVYSEIQFPIATYENDPKGYQNFNNQFNFSVGVSFNL